MNRNSGKNSKASTVLIAGLLLVIAADRASGQAAPVEGSSNIECLERLELPDYPPLARMVRITSIQTVKILLSAQATMQSIESSAQTKTAATEKDFRDSTEKALKNSLFSKTCGGKTVTLVFQYEFRENSDKSLFAFTPPNHFWIRAELPYVDHQPLRKR